MRKLLVCAAVCLVPLVAFAQQTPEAFLSGLPGLPPPCGNSEDVLKQHGDKLASLSEQIKTELDRLRASANARAESSKEQVGRDMAAKAGVSQDLMKKVMAGGELTEAEEKLLEEQALAKYGLTTAEAKKGNVPAKPMAGNKAAGNTIALEKERATLAEKVAMPSRRAQEKQRQLDNDPEAKRIDTQIAALTRQKESLSGCIGELNPANVARCDQIQREMKGLRKQYCEKLGPPYYAILGEELPALKSVLPDFARLEQVQAELEKAQTGISLTPPGIMALEAVRNFVGKYGPHYDLPDPDRRGKGTK